MSSVSSLGVSSSSTSQAQKLAMLAKLFQTNGNPSGEATSSSSQKAGPPPPPPGPPPSAQGNSSGGLASMYAALQSSDSTDNTDSSITDLVSSLLDAVDADDDGTISDDELSSLASALSGSTESTRPSLYAAMAANDGFRWATVGIRNEQL